MAVRIKESTWNGVPLFSCPFCPHATTEGKGAIETHMTSVHADQIRFAQLVKDAHPDEEEAEEKDGETPEASPGLAAGSGGHSATATTAKEGSK
jgi:hypothetical protein